MSKLCLVGILTIGSHFPRNFFPALVLNHLDSSIKSLLVLDVAVLALHFIINAIFVLKSTTFSDHVAYVNMLIGGACPAGGRSRDIGVSSGTGPEEEVIGDRLPC
jgi:hypothetical protein